jgi:tRNA pseudouridine38-40 synthase
VDTPTRTVKLTLEYDGTDFVGWQVQPNGRSVQEVVEGALARLLGEPVRVTGAGRTDAGVHARGQVCSLRTEKRIPLRAFVLGMNSLLPPDVAVVEAADEEPGFDARRSASGKRYEYAIWNGPTRSPLRRRRAWEVFRPLDVRAMREAAGYLLGEHDFSAFRASDCPAKTTRRLLRVLDVSGEAGGEITVAAEATAFLKHMVRNLVGTLVEVGHGKRAPGSMPGLLASGDRTRAGVTAPPQGLTLVRVDYHRR